MKSPEEIREHLAALKVLRRAPCKCRGTTHEQACVDGGIMMEVAIKNLEWALGIESPHMREFIKELNATAKKIVAGN